MPVIDETGLRGHVDKRPTKQSIEALLPGSIANPSPDGVFIVELAGTPQPQLMKESIPEGVAMLLLDHGALIYVFAPEVTMAHGLTVGMTRTQASALQRSLRCRTSTTSSVPASTWCTLPAMPSFTFQMHDDRIDHIVFVREAKTGSK